MVLSKSKLCPLCFRFRFNSENTFGTFGCMILFRPNFTALVPFAQYNLHHAVTLEICPMEIYTMPHVPSIVLSW